MTARQTTDALYAAFAERDPAALLELMHPDFVGEVSEGMPNGWGGVHEGPRAMLTDCWGPVFGAYETAPVPESIAATDGGGFAVFGHYRGRARESGRTYDAAFVHLLSFAADGRLLRLVQVTDTARWHEALAA